MSDTIKDITKLKVADLKRELRVRSLSTVGNKQELQDRLQLALQDGTDSALLLDDTGTVDTEDILNEDDVLGDEDDSSVPTPTDVGAPSLKRQLVKDLGENTVTSTPTEKVHASKVQDNGPPAKKITLNRKVLSQDTAPIAIDHVQAEKKDNDEGAKKVVKLSEISMQERLALRAVKFGESTSADAKKLARAARFGESCSESKKEGQTVRSGLSASSVTSSGNVPEVNVDVLKRRAERFGIQPGSKVELVEMEERKKKRLERFGGSATVGTNGSLAASASKAETAPIASKSKTGRIPITAPAASVSQKTSVEDKKKVRAERFKSNPVIVAK